ncbi:hypothetical protein S7335_5067 [Synechococcus sp. PCC 7335]|nr:hypothetical protein [Synechococcus sp. PCC 7335]EDX87358.1 hypothetical protein S7335_5067 [Synechococcus sp. PCC 7335]
MAALNLGATGYWINVNHLEATQYWEGLRCVSMIESEHRIKGKPISAE